jgi:hypothetical protein
MHRLLAILLLLALIPRPAHALLIDDFIKDYNGHDQEIFAYGNISMYALKVGMDGNEARTHCMVDWYKEKGKEEFFTAITIAPVQFKAKYGFDKHDPAMAHVELLMIVLANRACPAK